MSANDKQVGGSHYKAAIQHWDIVKMHELDYFQGQITKYVMRWKKKNGIQDLEKALHFLEKYIELEKANPGVMEAVPGDTLSRNELFQLLRKTAPPDLIPPHPAQNADKERGMGLRVEGYYGDGRIQYTHVPTKRTVIATSPENALLALGVWPAATPVPPLGG